MTEARPLRHRGTDTASRLDALWRQYKQQGAPEAREQLILHYAPLVKYVASRVATGLPANVEQADLISYGMFGLMDAIQKFDLERAIKFQTYAIPRIRGAIIDELRSMDWVPRSIRAKLRELERAHAELEARLQRVPSDREVAHHLGTTVEELHDVITQISFVTVMALDELVGAPRQDGESISLVDSLADLAAVDPTTAAEGGELRVVLQSAISRLSEREQLVIRLYYFEGMTLGGIGEILGVTESRVCQIHTKAVGSLRGRLEEQEAR